MQAQDFQHLVVLFLAAALAISAYMIGQRALNELLSRMVKVPGGIEFYRRTFLLMLLFGALGPSVAADFKSGAGMHFMEYVWGTASALENTLGYIFLGISLYLVLITILVATLKPQNDK